MCEGARSRAIAPNDARCVSVRRPSLCVEIGSGSGALITGLALSLQHPVDRTGSRGEQPCPVERAQNDGGDEHDEDLTVCAPRPPECMFLAVDKNPDACGTTRRTLRSHGIKNSDCVRTSLVENLQVWGQVDVLIFNPPYVVTPPEEMEGCGISISWAGGQDGRKVVDRFLPLVPRLLSKPNGVFYLVGIEENHPDEIVQLLNPHGLEAVFSQRQECGIESLFVLKFSWRADTSSNAKP